MRNGGRVLLAVENLYYELKFVWRYSTLIIPSLRTAAVGIYCKQRWHGVYNFDSFKFNNDLNFLFSEMSLKCTGKLTTF